MKNRMTWMTLLLCLSGMTATAQVPAQINTQGRVSVDGTNFNGTAQFQFALVDGGTDVSRQATAWASVNVGTLTSVHVADGGAGYLVPPAVTFSYGSAAATAQIGGGAVTNIVIDDPGSEYLLPPSPQVTLEAPPPDMEYAVYWTNGAPMDVVVTKGLYSVALGDTTLANMAALPPEVFTHSDVNLRVSFDDGFAGPVVLSPDSRIASVGYARMAETVLDGAITTDKIADEAVGEDQLATDAVTSDKIADEAVGKAQLADQSVSVDKIAVKAVGEDQLADEAVTSDKIADGTIDAEDVDAASFSNTFWKTDGNGGTTPGTHFLGTTDNEALEIQVNNQRALRIDPDATSPKIAAGYSGNMASQPGSVVAGGGQSLFPNQSDAAFSSIGGGLENTVANQASNSVIAGGDGNRILAHSFNNFIGGGNDNTIQTNTSGCVIAGGVLNTVQPSAFNNFIGGGFLNTVQSNASCNFIGGGWNNNLQTNASAGVIGGGLGNTIQADSMFDAIGGGMGNQIGTNASHGFIGGGHINAIGNNSSNSVMAGGRNNRIFDNSADCSIGGGWSNTIQDSRGTMIGGGRRNSIMGGGSTIAGGNDNEINALWGAIGGGIGNINFGDSSIIGGGFKNTIQSPAGMSFIGGGYQNSSHGGYSIIGGGYENSIDTNASDSVIGGGRKNYIGSYAYNSMIPGGSSCAISNEAYGSFAAGTMARAAHPGSFVWSDTLGYTYCSTTTPYEIYFSSTTSNEVSFRCQGGVRFIGGSYYSPNHQVSWVPGDGAWTFRSDQEKKEQFRPVDAAAVLQKVADLPLKWWVYKGYDVQHIGPMAQDFHAAFDLGRDQKGLDGADLDGVALAAIQGLALENRALKSENESLQAEISALKARVTANEQQIQSILDQLEP